MADTITISGTDPTNPRCAGDIAARLEQIERDTKAMADEAGRLMLFAGSIREVMTEQGVRPRSAQRAAEDTVARCKHLRRLLSEVSEAARTATVELLNTGVNPRARFEWRPTGGR